MKTKEKKLLVIIVALVLALVVVLVGALVYFGANNEEKKDPKPSGIIITGENSEPSVNNSEVSDAKNPDVLTEGTEISTPCGIVFYPDYWEDYLVVENVKETDGESVKFYAQLEGKEKIHLFDLNFGIRSGNRLGTVNAGGKPVVLYFEAFKVEFSGSWNDDEKNTIYSMQEDINEIIAQFDINTEGSAAVEPTSGKVKIETPYGNINFPGEWEEYLYTEIDSTGDYTVKFYSEINGKRYPLFEISFGEKADNSFGKVKGSDVWANVAVSEVELGENISQSEADIVFGMQEAFNDILVDLTE